MCKLVRTLWIMTRDGISSLRSFRVETKPKPSFSRVTGMRARDTGFLKFKIGDLAFEDLKDSTRNIHFEFGVVPS